jgi:hypothetical protein
VGPAQEPLLVPVLQVPAEGRWRRLNGLGQVRQRHETALADQVQHFLTAFIDQHSKILREIEQKYSRF